MTRNKHVPHPRPVIAALLAGLVGMFVLTAAACSERSPKPVPTEESRMKTVLIPIEGMSCMSCAARVTKTLEALPGVADAEVSLADRNARVQFAPNEISVAQVVAAVNGLGYRTSVPSEAK